MDPPTSGDNRPTTTEFALSEKTACKMLLNSSVARPLYNAICRTWLLCFTFKCIADDIFYMSLWEAWIQKWNRKTVSIPGNTPDTTTKWELRVSNQCDTFNTLSRRSSLQQVMHTKRTGIKEHFTFMALNGNDRTSHAWRKWREWRFSLILGEEFEFKLLYVIWLKFFFWDKLRPALCWGGRVCVLTHHDVMMFIKCMQEQMTI